MYKLSDLLKYIKSDIQLEQDCALRHIVNDSRLVEKGDIFFARVGHKDSGLNYIAEAKQRGAVAIMVEDQSYTIDDKLGLPQIVLSEAYNIGLVANWFYNYPSKECKVIGVTGTNGKTTTTHMVASLLGHMGYKTALMGTLGCGFLDELSSSNNTTLDEISIQRTMRSLVDQGAKYIVMEVSSIGVCEHRVDHIDFYAGAFSNLSRDHLDYHGTMDNYLQAKKSFLNMVKLTKRLAINAHDEHGANLILQFVNAIAIGHKNDRAKLESKHNRYLILEQIEYLKSSQHLIIDGSFGRHEVDLELMGHFNAENLMLALGLLVSMGFGLKQCLQQVPKIKAVKGRMQCLEQEGKPCFIIDYAHTPDGVEQILKACRRHFSEQQIYCVIGCGGDRDKGKRAIMAQKACVYADHAIFTEDNPRSEDSSKIMHDMTLGVVGDAHNYTIIYDRKEAIAHAFKEAQAQDCIVVAGKGHENYQIFKDKTIHFSDEEVCEELLNAKS